MVISYLTDFCGLNVSIHINIPYLPFFLIRAVSLIHLVVLIIYHLHPNPHYHLKNRSHGTEGRISVTVSMEICIFCCNSCVSDLL